MLCVEPLASTITTTILSVLCRLAELNALILEPGLDDSAQPPRVCLQVHAYFHFLDRPCVNPWDRERSPHSQQRL